MTELLSKPTGASACSSGKTAGLTIAVFVDQGQLPCALYMADRVALFHKRSGVWTESESRRVHPPDTQSAEEIAAFLHSLAALTEGAQAVAGKPIGGRTFAALNQLGKHIFEISAVTPEELSGIAGDVALAEAKKAVAEEAFKAARPAETEIQGVYSLDLVTALEEFPELSSKMILRPFLRSTPFTELTIICRHIPQWLLQEREIAVHQKQRGEYLVLTIQKQLCGEAIG